MTQNQCLKSIGKTVVVASYIGGGEYIPIWVTINNVGEEKINTHTNWGGIYFDIIFKDEDSFEWAVKHKKLHRFKHKFLTFIGF